VMPLKCGNVLGRTDVKCLKCGKVLDRTDVKCLKCGKVLDRTDVKCLKGEIRRNINFIVICNYISGTT
jgi:ssDNA-binding Zn-finger/Zn-ribbon topoisomerase 1